MRFMRNPKIWGTESRGIAAFPIFWGNPERLKTADFS